ncbi:MAG TPA: sugar ABC transporter permease [Anaeromyxobacteraceae bacterium]|nr:sugar ABC transporter permease [Anaeromyxobacteraceae bacterium]
MRWRRHTNQIIGFLVLLPSMALVGVFVYSFIGRTLYASLTDWGQDPAQALALNPITRFIGLDNYRQLFTGVIDARFRQDLVSTVFFTAFFLAGCLLVGLLLAILIDHKPRGEGFFRGVFLFPFALSFVVTGTIWRWLLQPGGGVNQLPTMVGLPAGSFAWLTSKQQVWRFDWNALPAMLAWAAALSLAALALSALRSRRRGRAAAAAAGAVLAAGWALLAGPAAAPLPFPELHGFNLAFVGIVVAAVWQMAGYTMALYLAGLSGVPEEIREAAVVEGASEWQLYTRVILPLLAPITLSAMIVLGHISLKIFDLVFAMAGPDNAYTDVPALLMYITTFRGNQFAKGAAIGVILLLLVAVIVVPYLRSQLKEGVHE